jgi:hypothetical protein
MFGGGMLDVIRIIGHNEATLQALPTHCYPVPLLMAFMVAVGLCTRRAARHPAVETLSTVLTNVISAEVVTVNRVHQPLAHLSSGPYSWHLTGYFKLRN